MRTPRYIVTYESMPIDADSPEEAIELHTANERGGGTWNAVEVTEGDDLAVVRDMPDPRDDALDLIAAYLQTVEDGDEFDGNDPEIEHLRDVLDGIATILRRTGREV